ncbi:hypothetical protein [Flavobacterium luteolum]|uniref:hypothetical protein n=1 Tax=Flavobacterium luteolum TaxID=3003259 RepID=UPI00248EC5A1|nr:hypothetical protein [Flavobacterium luteolum]
MENKNQPITFVFWIVAIILGVTLYKQFDFQNLKFENPAMAVIYSIVFVFSVYYIIKNSGKQPK